MGDAVWTAWDASLKIEEVMGTEGGNSSYSYTSAFSAETTATFKEECEKITGNTWTSGLDRAYTCRMAGEDGNSGAWQDVTVDVSNTGVCIPATTNCNDLMTNLKELNITAVDLADDEMYFKLIAEKDIHCNAMTDDDSGGVVPSTTFLGSVVAATAVVLAFTVLN